MANFRIICRRLHRDISYLFSGMLLVYAVSGIALNHKDTYNSQYDIQVRQFSVGQPLPARESINRTFITEQLLEPLGEAGNYTKHYFPEEHVLKIFLKGGSNLLVDTESGQATYESVRRRPLMGSLSRLHYNPGRAWTIFSDLFAVALILIILSGIFMLKGKHGLWGWGGIELLVGIAIPLLFILL